MPRRRLFPAEKNEGRAAALSSLLVASVVLLMVAGAFAAQLKTCTKACDCEDERPLLSACSESNKGRCNQACLVCHVMAESMFNRKTLGRSITRPWLRDRCKESFSDTMAEGCIVFVDDLMSGKAEGETSWPSQLKPYTVKSVVPWSIPKNKKHEATKQGLLFCKDLGCCPLMGHIPPAKEWRQEEPTPMQVIQTGVQNTVQTVVRSLAGSARDPPNSRSEIENPPKVPAFNMCNEVMRRVIELSEYSNPPEDVNEDEQFVWFTVKLCFGYSERDAIFRQCHQIAKYILGQVSIETKAHLTWIQDLLRVNWGSYMGAKYAQKKSHWRAMVTQAACQQLGGAQLVRHEIRLPKQARTSLSQLIEIQKQRKDVSLKTSNSLIRAAWDIHLATKSASWFFANAMTPEKVRKDDPKIEQLLNPATQDVWHFLFSLSKTKRHTSMAYTLKGAGEYSQTERRASTLTDDLLSLSENAVHAAKEALEQTNRAQYQTADLLAEISKFVTCPDTPTGKLSGPVECSGNLSLLPYGVFSLNYPDLYLPDASGSYESKPLKYMVDIMTAGHAGTYTCHEEEDVEPSPNPTHEHDIVGRYPEEPLKGLSTNPSPNRTPNASSNPSPYLYPKDPLNLDDDELFEREYARYTEDFAQEYPPDEELKIMITCSPLPVKIAQGGSGVVYSTTTPSGRKVVLKRFLVYDMDALSANFNEIRVNEHMKKEGTSGHTIEFLGWFIDHVNQGGISYTTMVFEYLPLTLEKLVEDHGEQLATNPLLVRAIVQQLAAGLADMHKAGVMHRDFKLDNVMMTALEAPLTVETLHLKIGDFDRSFIMPSSDNFEDGYSRTSTTLWIEPPENMAMLAFRNYPKGRLLQKLKEEFTTAFNEEANCMPYAGPGESTGALSNTFDQLAAHVPRLGHLFSQKRFSDPAEKFYNTMHNRGIPAMWAFDSWSFGVVIMAIVSKGRQQVLVEAFAHFMKYENGARIIPTECLNVFADVELDMSATDMVLPLYATLLSLKPHVLRPTLANLPTVVEGKTSGDVLGPSGVQLVTELLRLSPSARLPVLGIATHPYINGPLYKGGDQNSKTAIERLAMKAIIGLDDADALSADTEDVTNNDDDDSSRELLSSNTVKEFLSSTQPQPQSPPSDSESSDLLHSVMKERKSNSVPLSGAEAVVQKIATGKSLSHLNAVFDTHMRKTFRSFIKEWKARPLFHVSTPSMNWFEKSSKHCGVCQLAVSIMASTLQGAEWGLFTFVSRCEKAGLSTRECTWYGNLFLSQENLTAFRSSVVRTGDLDVKNVLWTDFGRLIRKLCAEICEWDKKEMCNEATDEGCALCKTMMHEVKRTPMEVDYFRFFKGDKQTRHENGVCGVSRLDNSGFLRKWPQSARERMQALVRFREKECLPLNSRRLGRGANLLESLISASSRTYPPSLAINGICGHGCCAHTYEHTKAVPSSCASAVLLSLHAVDTLTAWVRRIRSAVETLTAMYRTEETLMDAMLKEMKKMGNRLLCPHDDMSSKIRVMFGVRPTDCEEDEEKLTTNDLLPMAKAALVVQKHRAKIVDFCQALLIDSQAMESLSEEISAELLSWKKTGLHKEPKGEQSRRKCWDLDRREKSTRKVKNKYPTVFLRLPGG